MICETWSRCSARFLETTISRKGCKFKVEPIWKETSLGIPLGDDSSHPKHIRSSWPKAMVHRLGRISTYEQYVVKAQKQLVARFKKHHASPNLIRIISSATPWRIPRRNATRKIPIKTHWMPMGFHPVLRGKVERSIRCFIKDAQWNQLYERGFGNKPNIRIAWYNVLPSLMNRVRKLGRKVGA